jgi:hypothetical protein
MKTREKRNTIKAITTHYILRRLNEAASARLGDLTAAMVEEYELS